MTKIAENAVAAATPTAEDIRHAEKRTKAEQARLDTHDAARVAAPGVTAETITESIIAGVGALAACFHELEPRVRGVNGKLYPLNASMPCEAAFDQSTGEEYVENVNRFAYMQRQVASVVPWKLESMLEQAEDRITDQRRKIAQAVRQLENGRTDEAMIGRMADFLETLVEQRAMLSVAFDAACDGYEAAIGEAYETKAMRAERDRKVRSQPVKSDLDARLARLGVR